MAVLRSQSAAKATATMTQKEVAAALATSRTAKIVEISKDLKPQVQAQMLRDFVSNAQRQLRSKSLVLAVIVQ